MLKKGTIDIIKPTEHNLSFEINFDILTFTMKANIHPTWYPEAKVTCACGNTFLTGSTLPEIHVQICSACHPFFTGQSKFVDTLGQVDRFVKKVEVSKVKKEERKKIMEARKSKFVERKKERPTLKELLMQARKQATS